MFKKMTNQSALKVQINFGLKDSLQTAMKTRFASQV